MALIETVSKFKVVLAPETKVRAIVHAELQSHNVVHNNYILNRTAVKIMVSHKSISRDSDGEHLPERSNRQY